MSITALQATTIRQIGSTQCLTDPASVVKELIENSLDADATAIYVEISCNTMEKIKVRDNGHGIAPEDRGMVCKRHHTSKISTLEDLHNLGGQSLGFRGEALASAADMSTRILLTTRVEGEPTAMEIGYDRAGLRTSEKPTSHPVGTTVEVAHFLSNFPVRKRSAEKTSAKCLLKIKKSMQSYALARPCVRFSLKVLKAKNEKGDWNYAPSSEANSGAAFQRSILDAAIKIFGRKAAEQLRPHSFTWSSIGEAIESTESGFSCAEASVKDEYRLDFLIVRDSITETACINKLGQHITIDARPVSCHRGILKDISRYYKSCLESAVGDRQGTRIVDPLLIMNISCPTRSYDINIEPTKDDVLFVDAGTLLQVSQRSFDSIYGKPKEPLERRTDPEIAYNQNGFDSLPTKQTRERVSSTATETLQPPESASPNLEDRFEIPQSLRRNSVCSQIQQQPHSPSRVRYSGNTARQSDDQEEVNFLAMKESSRRASVFAGDQQNLELYKTCVSSPSPSGTDSVSKRGESRHINVSNPWTLSNNHALFRPPREPHKNHEQNANGGLLPDQPHHQCNVTSEATISSDNAPITPNASPIPFPDPVKTFSKRRPDDIAIEVTESGSTFNGFDTLDPCSAGSRSINRLKSKVHESFEICEESDESPIELTTARNLPIYGGTALCDIPEVSQRPRKKAFPRKKALEINGKSYVSPFTNSEHVWFDVGEYSHAHRSQKGHNKSPNSSINLRSEDGALEMPASVQHPDLAIALDYEIRKAKATQDHRAHLQKEKAAATAWQQTETAKQRTLDSFFATPATQPNLCSPHRNRQQKAIASLHTNVHTPINGSRETILTVSTTDNSPSKRSSRTLPLERIKVQDKVSDLILPLSTTRAAIMDQMERAINSDDYVHSGECTNGFVETNTALLKVWERRVRQLVGGLYRKGDPHVEDGVMLDQGDVVFDPSQIFLTSRSENV